MSRFTKEELRIIKNNLNWSEYHLQNEKLNEISKQLQSMIDLYDTETIEAWHCEKCGHVQ